MTNVSCQLRALVLAEGLRDAGLTVETHLAGASAKSQMKRARDCGARVIVEAQDEARVAIVQAGAAKGEGIVTWAEAVARISQIVGAKAKIDGE